MINGMIASGDPMYLDQGANDVIGFGMPQIINMLESSPGSKSSIKQLLWLECISLTNSGIWDGFICIFTINGFIEAAALGGTGCAKAAGIANADNEIEDPSNTARKVRDMAKSFG